MSAGAWGWPPLTRRCVAVLRRNFLVWRKTALTTVLGDVLDPIVALLALGFGLGALLPGIEGVPYVTFLSAGSMCVGALYGATFEATYNAFSRLHVQRTWDAMLSTPLDLDDVVWAEILWAAAKALKSGIAILLVVVALDIARAPTLLWVPSVLALAGLAFASMALVVSALARGYEFFMYYFTLGVTPMVFLSGVFFPASQLPAALAGPLQWLPVAPAVNLIRPLTLGQVPHAWWADVAQLAVTAALGIWLVAVLMRRRLLR
ncbi:ABC transporter permease [Bordetella genomosp. 6]|uniref:ABC transporter permease n=1 Tax=Bordetella genomosp. 6 TaxID=463024 RepID=UPI000A292DBE|nr:ABC transporter permease [Bordetella genomosp. 6]ARP76094.1 nodulation protein NodJ [Bordetella genomosp. 6]